MASVATQRRLSGTSPPKTEGFAATFRGFHPCFLKKRNFKVVFSEIVFAIELRISLAPPISRSSSVSSIRHEFLRRRTGPRTIYSHFSYTSIVEAFSLCDTSVHMAIVERCGRSNVEESFIGVCSNALTSGGLLQTRIDQNVNTQLTLPA